MPGIKWLKAQEEVIAMPDDAYPPWLWNLLKPKKFTKAERGPGSVEEHAKKNRENRQKIRDANFMQTQ
jgi:large subunit ribosomal protein L54